MQALGDAASTISPNGTAKCLSFGILNRQLFVPGY
jgi:hypothetical protein